MFDITFTTGRYYEWEDNHWMIEHYIFKEYIPNITSICISICEWPDEITYINQTSLPIPV